MVKAKAHQAPVLSSGFRAFATSARDDLWRHRPQPQQMFDITMTLIQLMEQQSSIVALLNLDSMDMQFAEQGAADQTSLQDEAQGNGADANMALHQPSNRHSMLEVASAGYCLGDKAAYTGFGPCLATPTPAVWRDVETIVARALMVLHWILCPVVSESRGQVSDKAEMVVWSLHKALVQVVYLLWTNHILDEHLDMSRLLSVGLLPVVTSASKGQIHDGLLVLLLRRVSSEHTVLALDEGGTVDQILRKQYTCSQIYMLFGECLPVGSCLHVACLIREMLYAIYNACTYAWRVHCMPVRTALSSQLSAFATACQATHDVHFGIVAFHAVMCPKQGDRFAYVHCKLASFSF